jgi:hypothetical protein
MNSRTLRGGILAASLLLASCRAVVLEDRTMCPSFLFFDVADASRFQRYSGVFTTVYAHPEGRLMDEAGTSLGYIDDRLFFFTVRGTAAVKGYGLMGQEGLVRDGSVWTVPIGRDYVPIFRFGYMAEVQEETFTVPVEFTKEYSHVSVQYIGADTFDHAGGRFPFYITVRGNTCGIDALTGNPVTGPFQITPKESGIGHFEFTLPRQADHTLVLEMYALEGLYEYRDFQTSYNLYELLRDKGGITWTEKNLPDLYIEIDFEETTVNVGVYPWGEQELEYGL